MITAAAMSLSLIAGISLAPIESSYAAPRTTGGFSDTSSLKHVIRDGVTVNLQHRDQHMIQENLCYRNNTCRQSSVGQNTLGNDNSVTGFDDQSDNIQKASPTTATRGNLTTPIPTPTPTPTTTSTLTVRKIISGNTTATPANFTIHVTGNNPTPANFAGSSAGTVVMLDPGPFSVTETSPSGTFFTNTTAGDCAGTVTAGQRPSCTITNTPKTCEECFRSILNQSQLTAVLGVASIAQVCATFDQITEVAFRAGLINLGIPGITADELIACLKAAGIVFAP
jgi:hypothetical protein